MFPLLAHSRGVPQGSLGRVGVSRDPQVDGPRKSSMLLTFSRFALSA